MVLDPAILTYILVLYKYHEIKMNAGNQYVRKKNCNAAAFFFRISMAAVVGQHAGMERGPVADAECVDQSHGREEPHGRLLPILQLGDNLRKPARQHHSQEPHGSGEI